MYKRISGLIILLCVTAVYIQAMDLTVDEAVEIALEQNLELQSTYIGQRTLEREKNSNWNEFLPDASVSAGLGKTNTQDAGYPEYWNLSLGFNTSLDLSADTYFQIKDTIMDYQKGLITQDIAVQKLKRDVRKAFYYIILIRETIDVNIDMIDTAFKRYERAKVNYELGNIAYVEVLSYQVAWENMKPQLINLENSYETSLWEFKRLLGIDLEENIVIVGEIESDIQIFDSENIISEYMYDRLEVQYFSKLVEQIRVKKGMAAAQTMTPVLGLGYSWNSMMDDPFGDEIDNPEWNDNSGSMNMSLTLPLDGFIPNSQKNLYVKKYKDQLERAELTLENQVRGNAIDIQSVVLLLNKSASTIDSLELNVDLAQENYNLVDSSYTEGILDFLDVQNADDELNKAKLMVVDEKYNYISALMDLQYIINNDELK
ncbi:MULTISPECIES: TolC family protein [unclassified Oceanispirochaeta]|uniref:TolC family protein n=1 Tax=unclassified Oceanispirochaeta TaxID=2635722 RepID=UPI000E096626|nr:MULTISPECIES: TolC family protein [unclassified Oceanispirochaeta]MBF9016424.1 TolC family protein [Oceanispirochaeta sp. M2]NPD72886.1 TolC family protein [Oceanispirochaeta sp. M1]RDG31463.1 TolC family protein [Oceanispirochaeta sp. M1]